MPRQSIIDNHPDLKEIEKAILSGESVREIAKRYSVPKSSVQRYKTDRIGAGLRDVIRDNRDKLAESRKQERSIKTGQGILEQIEDLQREAMDILTTTKKEGKYHNALDAIGKLTKLIELQGKLLGELRDDEVRIAIILPPGMENMRTVSGGQGN